MQVLVPLSVQTESGGPTTRAEVRKRVQVRDNGDFTVALDRDGLVIYCSINGHRFFFHGHVGVVIDNLPDYAHDVYSTLLLPEAEQAARFEELAALHGEPCRELIADLEEMQRGDHVALAPEEHQATFVGNGIPGIFNVYLSQSCNLACTYCFNQRGTFGKPASVMNAETAQHTLDFIRQAVRTQAYDVFTINLFGGEPTLATDAVRLLARGLQDLNKEGLSSKVHIMLSTNGTVYDAELYAILAEAPDCNTVVVSLDAFKDRHDQNRPFANPAHGSSYDTVVANLRRMVAEGVPCSVVCVVPNPYDFIAAAEELHSFGIPILEIKQLNHHIYGKEALPEVFRRDFETWRQNYIAYSDYYLDYLDGAHGPPAAQHVDRQGVFGEYHSALYASRRARLTLACRVADTKVGIAADGRITPCEAFLRHDQFDLGTVRAGFDPDRVREFERFILEQGQHRVDNEQCRTCFAKLVCGGGCYAESFDKKGELAPLEPATCAFVREKVKIDLYYMARLKERHPQIHEALAAKLG